ncbi:myosin phosphatase Rho-interacting protein-like isoform X1 [Oreochromis aureus]|uniref:PH domain-containing protein n=1 Tax=Oreochromis aureus TaxID=47969 RepID=A0A668RA84_OREAU|nr:myosin phosphatase Rho-interacting protein-like isoform X1 [Oreochromis aureus]
MSGEKAAATPCSKFQANIFNKSKCQNCFKSRELHPLNDHDLEQAKPIYAGWLCLAPEGTDFNNPMQRSRRWQRRFFILYEDGSLSFALDELPSTLPQGTLNVNVCTDIFDAEPRTGQKNALCIVTPEQEVFIRGDNKDIINGWSEQLAVYLQTHKQNQKKKRKVEPVANQEPSPAKMVATDLSFPSSGRDRPEPGRWQEDQRDGGPDVTPIWTVTDAEPPGPERTPAGNASSYLCLDPRGSLTSDGTAGFGGSVGSSDLAASESADTGRNNRLAEHNDIQTSANNKNQRQDGSKNRSEATRKEQETGASVSRTGRSETRTNKREKLQSCGDSSCLVAPPPQRRAKSLDRRTSDTAMTPDLLNFKKGWMVKLDENDQWKKYWFVLSTDSLRYYKDSMAEEASDLEGEINLTKCYNVSEYQVQRNYGFQIHTLKGVVTLSAMTAGIRKNWIQALMKNVHPANAPDVASLPGQHIPCSPSEVLPKPDVTQDSPSADISLESDPHPKASSVTERRHEGRYRTFDWAEFKPESEPVVDADPQKSPCSLELGDLERRKRREERRRRYEKMLGFSLLEKDGTIRALSPKSQQRMEEEMEECWKQVEKTMFRLERTVPLFSDGRDAEEMEKVLQSYRKAVEDLKVQLEESERRRLELEAQLSVERFQHQQMDSPVSPEADFYPLDMKEPLKDPTKSLKELLQQQNVIRQNMKEQLGQETPSPTPQLPSIWLHDTGGELQELEDLLSETAASPLLSPASDSQRSQSEGMSFDDRTADLQDQLDADARQLFPVSETQVDKFGSWAHEPAEGDESQLKQVTPDQVTLRKLSLEVELLTSQNDALNQRNQEMLNQLTEADREIERLKVELNSRYSEPRDLPEVEQEGKTRVEDLEMELNLKNQELQEAQTLISSLEENLRETEVLLQLSDPVGEDENKKRAEKPEGYLLRCFEATEAKLTELEKQLDQSELNCRELQEAEKLSRQRVAEAEADIRRLNEELEKERLKGDRSVSAEEKTQKVIEGMVARLSALGRLLEAIDRLDKAGEAEVGEGEGSPAVVSQLEWEEAFWSLLLNELKEDPSKLIEPADVRVGEAAEQMMLETRMLLIGHRLLQTKQAAQEGREGRHEGEANDIALETTKTEEESGIFDVSDCERFKVITQIKISLLDQLATSLSAAVHEELQPTADRLYEFHSSDHPWIASFIHSAASEALYRHRLCRLWAKYANCSKCAELREENEDLKAKLSNLEQQRTSKMSAGCQTDEIYLQDAELQSAQESEEEEEEELIDEMEIPQKVSDESLEESDEPDGNVELISSLRRKVEELEEQLMVSEDKMRLRQLQHEKETEKLKVTCERGLASMEEAHLKVVEELQRRHKQEVERLLVERDRLLEEESAATATAIEAIKNAHRLELQREVQKRCEIENSNGLSHLEDVHRQHSEELASCQRELEVLSQQFSLKCLENGHLVQALDAERKALCQCQQENQDLRTRNQELSGHLAAEITRLCTLAKQDALPLSQGMDVYEMEITLRVKESEVQCLKQEITSLKDELQSAQRDKRNATKKYKDMYTELSIVRAKTEREADELRENLRLAYQALGRTSP